jgi:hypothetical protein
MVHNIVSSNLKHVAVGKVEEVDQTYCLDKIRLVGEACAD